MRTHLLLPVTRQPPSTVRRSNHSVPATHTFFGSRVKPDAKGCHNTFRILPTTVQVLCHQLGCAGPTYPHRARLSAQDPLTHTGPAYLHRTHLPTREPPFAFCPQQYKYFIISWVVLDPLTHAGLTHLPTQDPLTHTGPIYPQRTHLPTHDPLTHTVLTRL